jgi:hypothetical protein
VLLRIPHRLERSNKELKRRIKTDEDVNGPEEGRAEEKFAISGAEGGGVGGVVVDMVLEEDLQDDVDGEDVFVEVDAAADCFDFEADDFPGGVLVLGNRFAMFLLDDVAPCVADGGEIAVVSCVVDVEADVVVASLVGVIVIELNAGQLVITWFE